jgi:DNA-directed RNA polymerase specialized sigma24 family protein
MLTAEALSEAYTDAAKEKRQRTIETRQTLEREDVLLLRKRGLVPLAIADELGISLRRVVDSLQEAGEEIPAYLITWNEPPREPNPCRRCEAARA